MASNRNRAAIYLRVSTTDRQTTENQQMALNRVAEHRGWSIVLAYEDQGISGAKGRDQRPAFDQMLKDAVRGRFDVLLVWSIDRLGRSVLHVANALAELDAAGRQQGKQLGRPKVRPEVEKAIQGHLKAGYGILKVAKLVGVGSGTVQRVKREMVARFAEAA